MTAQASEFRRLVRSVNRALRDYRRLLGADVCRPASEEELSACIVERFAAFAFDNERGGEFNVDTPRLLAYHLASGRDVSTIPRSGPERGPRLDEHSARFVPLRDRLIAERRKSIAARQRLLHRGQRAA